MVVASTENKQKALTFWVGSILCSPQADATGHDGLRSEPGLISSVNTQLPFYRRHHIASYQEKETLSVQDLKLAVFWDSATTRSPFLLGISRRVSGSLISLG